MLGNQLADVRSKLSLDADAFDGVAVLILPENIGSAEATDLKDAGDSLYLAKYLKAQGIRCKTAYDLGVRPKVLDRHGIDVWLGVVWLVEHFAAPTLVGLISAWLLNKYGSTAASTIHVELKLEDANQTSSLKYDGSLADFQKILQGLKGDSPNQLEQ